MKNKMKRFSIAVLSLVLFTSTLFATEEDILLQIKQNYKDILVPSINKNDSLLCDLIKIEPETEMSDQVVVELHQRYPFDIKGIENYLSKQQADGSWSDINYEDKKRSGWEPKLHAERILELSKLYYSQTTDYYQSDRVKKAIHSALGYWFTADPKCLNWWYNEIGVPKTLGAAFILLEDQLSEKEKDAAIRVMENSKFGMTGQNKVWLAGNVMIKALLQNDAKLVKAARDTISSEIVLGREEGIKNDWSFHQHGAQQQFGNYGLSFVSGMSFFSRLFKGTEYEFEQNQMDILTTLINEGYRWIIWHRYMDISALGRQLFHHAQVHKAYSLAFAAADLGLGGFSKSSNNLVGHKHFEDSDYTIHRSKDWMASIKMSSNRVIGTELVNEDNLKGYYMGDGATYYYVDGDEYLDIFPFWDWRKIPGVTTYEDNAPMPKLRYGRLGNRTDKVGGISNGKYGLTAMELRRDDLKAQKAWFITDEFVFCLGANIQSDSCLQVTTSIDQRLRQGDLSVWKNKKWEDAKGSNTFKQKDLRLFHDKTGYIVLGETECFAQAEKRSGQWHDFMGMYQPATVEGEVVALHLRHGVSPRNASYQYIVLPASSKDEVASFEAKKAVKVIKNDETAQIIHVPSAGKGYWIAAYKPQTLKIDGLSYTIQTPGVYYVEKEGKQLIEKISEPFRSSK